MKQYRDMTPEERQKSDLEWEALLLHHKMSAEHIMADFDNRPQHIRDRMKDGVSTWNLMPLG